MVSDYYTIFHYGGWGRNYGDLAIQYSMSHHLQALSETPLRFIPIDLKSPIPLTDTLIDHINELGDMLIIGGGGLIMKGDGFDTESGWQFNISESILNRLKVPLIVYSCGWNVFPHDILKPKALDHLAKTLSIAELSSARDKGSAKEIKKATGIDISVTPDPALFCPYDNRIFPSVPNPVIGLNWAGDRMENRFFERKNSKTLIGVLEHLNQVGEEIGESLNIISLPHVEQYDKLGSCIRVLGNPDAKLNYVNISHFDEEYPEFYPESLSRVPMFIGFYKNLDMVLGMRGHSNIFSANVNTPCIALGNHEKNKFFGADMGINCVDTDLTKLSEKISYLLSSPSQSVMEKKAEGRAKFDAFNTNLLEILHNG